MIDFSMPSWHVCEGEHQMLSYALWMCTYCLEDVSEVEFILQQLRRYTMLQLRKDWVRHVC